MSENSVCPGCPRHCTQSDVHCGRGYAYFQSGEASKPREHREKPGAGGCDAKGVPDGINEKLIVGLREVSHLMRLQYEGKASQKRILMILNEQGSITQRALTERLGIQPGSVSEILAKLEHAGLILRTPNTEDRRTADLCLTDAGRVLADEALEQRRARHKVMFSCLSETEKEELLGLLEKLHADWESRFCGTQIPPHPVGKRRCGRGPHHEAAPKEKG